MGLKAARISFKGSKNENFKEFIYSVLMTEKNNEEKAASIFAYIFGDATRK